jgi:hypothetical protein
LGTRAVGFDYHEDRITAIRLQDGTRLQAEWYVATVPPHELTPLLPERWLTRYAYFKHIADLGTISCTVIQVRTAEMIPNPRHILMGTEPFSWMACKPSQIDRGLVAILTMPQDQFMTDTIQRVSALLRSLKLLRPDRQITGFRQEDNTHAWLALPPGTNVLRPIQRSPVPNLLLAGAWTDTGWPANLESAIVSGQRSAELIMGDRR